MKQKNGSSLYCERFVIVIKVHWNIFNRPENQRTHTKQNWFWFQKKSHHPKSCNDARHDNGNIEVIVVFKNSDHNILRTMNANGLKCTVKCLICTVYYQGEVWALFPSLLRSTPTSSSHSFLLLPILCFKLPEHLHQYNWMQSILFTLKSNKSVSAWLLMNFVLELCGLFFFCSPLSSVFQLVVYKYALYFCRTFCIRWVRCQHAQIYFLDTHRNVW